MRCRERAVEVDTKMEGEPFPSRDVKRCVDSMAFEENTVESREWRVCT